MVVPLISWSTLDALWTYPEICCVLMFGQGYFLIVPSWIRKNPYLLTNLTDLLIELQEPLAEVSESP